MKPATGLGLVLVAMGLIGSMDYGDRQAQQDHQCQMIAEGHWPESVNPDCKE